MYGQARLGQILDSISLGFRQTPLEILLFFIIVLVLLAVFVLAFFGQKRRTNREIGRHSREVLEHLLLKLDLSDEETVLLGRLAAYLDPGVSEQALLVNWQVFSGCARKLQQSEDVSESRLDALRAKIGLTSNQAAEVPGSSAGLPEGSPVVLIAAAGARFRGTVIEQGPLAIAVRLSGGVSFPGKGVRASLYFHNSAGIYSFPTTIVDLVKDVVRVEQSSTVTFHQPRRKCLRRKEFLPIFVRLAASREAPHETILLDLSGAGASLTERKRIMTFIFAQSRRHGSLSGQRTTKVDVKTA